MFTNIKFGHSLFGASLFGLSLMTAYFQMPTAYYDPCGYKNVSTF